MPNIFTFGRPLTVYSDHKPLEAIKKKPLDRSPKRLQGMLVRALAYDIKVQYLKGNDMFLADTLSRASLPYTSVNDQEEFEIINHIKLCLLLWFEFFRTIALLLGDLRDLIVAYSKSSSASVKCRREIFGRANFHPRVVSLGINVFSKVRDDGRCTGEGKELCRPTEKTPRHYSLDFSRRFFRLH